MASSLSTLKRRLLRGLRLPKKKYELPSPLASESCFEWAIPRCPSDVAVIQPMLPKSVHGSDQARQPEVVRTAPQAIYSGEEQSFLDSRPYLAERTSSLTLTENLQYPLSVHPECPR